MNAFGRIIRAIKNRPSRQSVRALLAEMDLSRVHIGIIMDGNGRWATRRGLPRSAGHRAGTNNAKAIIEHAASLGVGYLTLFAFSTENWSRPDEEVSSLMSLFRETFSSYFDELVRSNIRVRVIGRREGLPADIQSLLTDVTEKTRHATGLVLTFALNYGGRAEIVDCVRSIAREVASQELAPEDIDERTISDHLYTAGIPDPDLIIRTSGELRLSNFLLWQGAYSEIVPFDTLWPDFRPSDLEQALAAFARRQRRYGGIGGSERGV